MAELTPHEVDLLGAYRDGGLTPEERASLEQRMREEPEFRRAAEQLYAVALALETASDHRIISFLKTRNHNRAAKHSRKWLWLIAGLVAVTIAGYFLFFLREDKTPKKQPPNPIAAFLRPPPSPASTLSLVKAEPDGYRVYDEGRYAEAIPLLEREFAGSGGTDSLRLFYKGIACLHTNDPATAIAIFSRFAGSKTIPQDDNRWFLALAYVQAGRYAQARDILKTLKESPLRGKDADILEKEILRLEK